MSDVLHEYRHRCRPGAVCLHTIVITLAVLGGAAGAAAQTVFDRNGFGENRDTYSVLPYEHVDPLSGNLLVLVTDLSLPGNGGLGLTVQRVYNSAVYPNYESGGDKTLEEDSWAGIGWRLHFGRVLHEGEPAGGATEIEMSDGSRHPLYHTTFAPEGWITKDFWVYDKNTHKLKLPNGIVYTFGHEVFLNPTLGVVRYVTEIRDPFNNTVTFTYFGAPGPPDGVAQVRQDLGGGQIREVNFTYDPAFNSLASMTYDGRTWTYTQQAFGPPGYSALTAVQPPAGKAWVYTYEAAPGYVGLTQMLVPSGGRVDYTYGDETRYAGPLTKLARVVKTRTISGHKITTGTWTFRYNEGPNKDQTIVECPCGTTIYRYLGIGLAQPGGFPAWSKGSLAERTVEDGSGLLEREVLTWGRSVEISPDPVSGEAGVWSDPAVYDALLEQRVLSRGGQTWTTGYEYRADRFNEFGRAWRVTESGELSRTTRRDFVYGFTPYLANRVAWEEVQVGPEIVRTDFTYDAATGFLREQNTAGLRVRYEPTATGNLDAIVDGNNNQTTFLYAWGVVREVRTPLLTTTRTISPAGETLSETTGSLTTQYGYDLAFRPTFIRPPGWSTGVRTETRYEYDGLHQEWVRIARGDSQISQQLDGFGRVIATTNRTNLKTLTRRDACGRATFESTPYTSGQGTVGVTTSYDALGRVRQVIAADGVTTTTYTYTGIDVDIQDPANRTTRYDFSAFGGPGSARLTRVRDAMGQDTRYTYEVLGHLTRVEGPGSGPARTWSYTAAGLPLTSFQPESGTTQYEHDAAGRLTRTTGSDGRVTILSYDANNRLTGRDAHDTHSDATYTYDTHGRLASVATSAVTTTYGYDAVGGLSSRTDVVNGRTFTSTYSHDANDRLTSVAYPAYPSNRRTVTYAYDIEGRLTTVQQNGATFAHGFTYDDSGRLAAYQTGAVVHTTTFDERDRVQRMTAGLPGAPEVDLTYSYDAGSRVQQITDPRPNMTQVFGYDPLDRLTSVAGPFPLQWTYDAEGNRLTQTHGTSVFYDYHPTTRRLSSTSGSFSETFAYDNAGRVIGDSAGTYTYAGNGLLRTVTNPNASATYTYDGEDVRLVREVNGRRMYTVRSADGAVLAEYEEEPCGTLVWTRDQIHAGGLTIGAVRANLDRPTVQFELASSTVGESIGSLAPRVRLTTATGAPTTCAVSVSVATMDGTAINNSDFVMPGSVLTFPAGTASGTLLPIPTAVSINNDLSYEPNESFSINLWNPIGVTIGALAQHAVTIQDNDGPPTISITDVTVNEAAGNATFTVSLSQPSGFTIYVNADAANGTAREYFDYNDLATVVTFDPQVQSRQISVPLINDAFAEPTETFEVQLWNPVNATIADWQGFATIVDDEPPRVPIDLSLPGSFIADASGRIEETDFLQIGNRHAVPVTARLTFTRNDGSGVTRDVVIPARRRLDLHLWEEAGIGGQDVSVAVQTTNPAYPLEAEHWVSSGPSYHSGRSTEGVAPSDYVFFAEGSVNGVFEEWITVYNLSNGPVDLLMAISTPNGYLTGPAPHLEPGPGRYKFRVRDLVGEGDFALWVRAVGLDGQNKPIVAERTMKWNLNGPESHSTPGVPSGTPLTAAYFAEGNNTNFVTYLCLLNPFPYAQQARIDYLHENNTTYTALVDVLPWARATVPSPMWLPAGSFGMKVTSNSGGGGFAAERVMYQASDFTVGTAGVGQKETGVYWAFTEGYTGWWDTYFLLANPQSVEAHVYLSFTRTDGTWITQRYVHLPPGSRRTIRVNDEPGMADQEFRTEVYSVGSPPTEYIVERATFWPGFGSSMLMTMPGQEWTATMSTIADDPSGEALTPGLSLVSPGIRAVPPPGLYHDVTEAVPAGPVERALAAAYEKQKEKEQKEKKKTNGTTDTTATTESGVSTLTTGGSWFGGHVTSGRKR